MSGARWATASALDRIFTCPTSAVLPQTRDVNVYSERGTRNHSAVEPACSDAPPEYIDLPDGFRLEVADLKVPKKSAAEVAFGFDVLSREVFFYGQVGARAYPDAKYSVLAGTADVVGFGEMDDGTETVDVADWKFSRSEYRSDSWQLRSLAFMAARHFGRSVARTRITKIVDGVVWHEPTKVWSAEELAETETLLVDAYDRVQKMAWKKDKLTAADVKRSSSCHFCPALQNCPYFTAILSGGRLAQLDTRDLAEAYGNMQALRTAMSRMEEALKAAASTTPIDLGEGYAYGKVGGRFVKHRR